MNTSINEHQPSNSSANPSELQDTSRRRRFLVYMQEHRVFTTAVASIVAGVVAVGVSNATESMQPEEPVAAPQIFDVKTAKPKAEKIDRSVKPSKVVSVKIDDGKKGNIAAEKAGWIPLHYFPTSVEDDGQYSLQPPGDVFEENPEISITKIRVANRNLDELYYSTAMGVGKDGRLIGKDDQGKTPPLTLVLPFHTASGFGEEWFPNNLVGLSEGSTMQLKNKDGLVISAELTAITPLKKQGNKDVWRNYDKTIKPGTVTLVGCRLDESADGGLVRTNEVQVLTFKIDNTPVRLPEVAKK